MTEDEPQLIERAQAGDGAAAAEIVQRYQRRVYSFCYRILNNEDLAAELTQETLIKVLTGLERFHGRSALATWIHRIATNTCYTHLRSERVRRSVAASWPEEGELAAPRRVQGERGGLDAGERRRLVGAALSRLQADHRVVLVLRDVQGLEYEQIAEAMDVPVGTVKSRLFRARAALREAIEAMTPDDSQPTTERERWQ